MIEESWVSRFGLSEEEVWDFICLETVERRLDRVTARLRALLERRRRLLRQRRRLQGEEGRRLLQGEEGRRDGQRRHIEVLAQTLMDALIQVSGLRHQAIRIEESEWGESREGRDRLWHSGERGSYLGGGG